MSADSAQIDARMLASRIYSKVGQQTANLAQTTLLGPRRAGDIATQGVGFSSTPALVKKQRAAAAAASNLSTTTNFNPNSTGTPLPIPTGTPTSAPHTANGQQKRGVQQPTRVSVPASVPSSVASLVQARHGVNPPPNLNGNIISDSDGTTSTAKSRADYAAYISSPFSFIDKVCITFDLLFSFKLD